MQPAEPMETCLICNKHKGIQALPPGGYIYQDEHWAVCHAPTNVGPLGTLFIESRRHFLDFAEFNEEEQKTLQDRIELFTKASLSFVFAGVNNTMNTFNGK